jgi:hypothetical protein
VEALRHHADLQAQSTKVFPGTTTTSTIMIPPRLTRAQQVTTAESSRTTVRPPGAGLLTSCNAQNGRDDTPGVMWKSRDASCVACFPRIVGTNR